MTSAGTVSRLRFHRNSGDPEFNADDKRRLEQFVPHLKQALNIRGLLQRNEAERQLYEEALDRLQIGTIMLDESAHVLRVNSSAENMLRSKDGIKQVNGVIEASFRAETCLLRSALDKSAHAPEAVLTLSLTRPKTDRKLSVAVRNVPLSLKSEGRVRPAWVIFLRDPDARTIAAAEALQHMFGLTRTEALLAAELANGLTLDDAAEVLGIKRNTARAHLRSIFNKTGVSRQTELVRVLLNGVIGLSASRAV